MEEEMMVRTMNKSLRRPEGARRRLVWWDTDRIVVRRVFLDLALWPDFALKGAERYAAVKDSVILRVMCAVWNVSLIVCHVLN